MSVLLLLLSPLLSPGLVEGSEPGSYTNPVLDSDHPDPGIVPLADGSGYLGVLSSGESPDTFPLMVSRDLVTWTDMGNVFPNKSWPAWVDSKMWAPEVHHVGGKYICYYSGSHSSGWHSIGAAYSDSPWGPYTDLGRPLVEHSWNSYVGLIDPSYFLDPVTGRHFLLWKGDTLLPLRPSVIYMRELASDGLTFQPESEPEVVLTSDRISEHLIVEGPWMIYRSGLYYLFYSSSWVQRSSYHVGVALSDRVTGPFTKSDLAVLQGEDGEEVQFEGPGHGSVLEDTAGDWWMVYAAWKAGKVNTWPPGRLMLVDKISWRREADQEWPHIGVPSDGPQPRPHGVTS